MDVRDDSGDGLYRRTNRLPPQFTALGLTPGYHVFSVLGTDAAGTVRTSDPVMVIVRKLLASG